MTKSNRVVILHNRCANDADIHEADVLEQAEHVKQALTELGFDPLLVPFAIDDRDPVRQIKELKPRFVFNLIEEISGKTDMAFVGPALLQAVDIPFTGCSKDALYLTTDKVLTKKLLRYYGLPTPDFIVARESDRFEPQQLYILKPIAEDASLGITFDNVKKFDNKGQLFEYMSLLKGMYNLEFFAEKYIPGREFNISMLGVGEDLQLFEPAEIQFLNTKCDNTFGIQSYDLKWVAGGIKKRFDFDACDQPLLEKIKHIGRKCCEHFELSGYARIDLRVDQNNLPWVIDINGNPCISHDSSFYLTMQHNGISYTEMIRRLLGPLAVGESMHFRVNGALTEEQPVF